MELISYNQKPAAVIVKNAVKSYEKEQLILDGLNMTVLKNSIYVLLGPSGCGKTTLLSCIVGIHSLDSGEMWVLGGYPGTKKSGVPGPRVGYMPQDVSLIDEFSVSNALYYFGRINGLDNEEIETRQVFLSELLQLPSENQLMKNMSGGQKRRLSIAATLIHKPELLILDEPTVGLDPILGEIIWTYFTEITQKENITILITTHYIEEAKNANKIGFMRCGKLLTEGNPQELLEYFQCSFLEDVFLKLCETQNNMITNNTHELELEDTSSNILSQHLNKYENNVSEHQGLRWKRFKALLAKNGIQFLRYYSGLIFAIILPIILFNIFLLAIGRDPKNLKIGVVNDEAGNCSYGDNFSNIWNDGINCHFNNLSCRFLHDLDHSIATQRYYNTIVDADHDFQNGEITGIIYFFQNFSEALEVRMEDNMSTEDFNLIASQIEIYLDMSNKQIGLFLKKKLFEQFLTTYKDIMKDCKYSPKLFSPPIRFEDPIFGTADANYRNYITPTFILLFSFFLATAVSTQLIIAERSNGLWNRSIAQGVRMEEILLSHIVFQSCIITIHTILICLIFFVIWGLECKGSIFLVIIFLYLNGFAGLMYGFVISVICKNEIMASFLSIGSFIPFVLISGMIWPIEGMPKVLHWFSFVLPITLPGISMRGILYKGYSISHTEVYTGCLIIIGWILLFFTITIFSIRSK